MHFELSSAICFNLGQSKILSSANGFMGVWSAQSQLFTLGFLKEFEDIVVCVIIKKKNLTF